MDVSERDDIVSTYRVFATRKGKTKQEAVLFRDTDEEALEALGNYRKANGKGMKWELRRLNGRRVVERMRVT